MTEKHEKEEEQKQSKKEHTVEVKEQEETVTVHTNVGIKKKWWESFSPTQLSKLTWQDYIAIVFMLFILVISINLTSGMQQLASPIYGGDYYYQLGAIKHVQQGGNPFVGSNVLGTLPGYLPFYSMLVAYPAKILGMESFTAMKLSSIIFAFLASILFYILIVKLSKNKTTGLLAFLLFFTVSLLPVFKYTTFAQVIMFPLFYLAAYAFLQKPSYKRAIIWGVLLGLMGITHAVGYIAGMIFFGVFALHYLFFSHLKWKGFKFAIDKKVWKQQWKYIAVIFLLAFILAMPYWFKPVFVHHGQTSSDYTGWNSYDLANPVNQASFMKRVVKNTFWYWNGLGNAHHFFITLFVLIGLIFLLINYYRQKGEERNVFLDFSVILGWSSFIGLFHYYLTQPILGADFIPNYVNRFSLFFFKLVLMIIAIKELVKLINRLPKEQRTKTSVFFVGFVIIVALATQVSAINHFGKNKWYQTSQRPLSGQFQGITDFLEQNTDINDVVLSTPEISFAINGLTGRKLMVSRRAQNDAFYDFDPHFRDAAAILYGNKTATKISLLKSYGVDYVYWDMFWIQSEYNFNKEGNIVSWFDPLIVFDTPENRKFLENEGIQYLAQHTWLDPTLKGDLYRKLDLLFIVPNYRSLEQPWTKELDPFLEEVWSHQQDERKVAILYKINTDKVRHIPVGTTGSVPLGDAS